MFAERFLQERPCPMQPGFHSFGAKPEQFRGLLNAHFFDDAGHQHGAESLRQIIDCLFHQTLNFSLSHSAFGIELWCWEWNDLSLPVLDGSYVDCRTLAAQTPQRLVQHDARKPCREARIAAELVEARESVYVGFLNDILGFAVVRQHSTSHPVESPIVPLHDDAKGSAVPLPCQLDELCVAKRLRVRNPSCIWFRHCPSPRMVSSALDAHHAKRFPTWWVQVGTCLQTLHLLATD